MAEEHEAVRKGDFFGTWGRHLREAPSIPLLALAVLVVLSLLLFSHLRLRVPWLTVLAGTLSLLLILLLLDRITPLAWFWRGLLGLAIFIYTGSLFYQAGAPSRVQSYQGWATPQVPGSPENLTLAIAYPRIAPLEGQDKPGWPLAVYLQGPTPPTSSTATVTPTIQSGQTPTPTLRLASPITYTVAFIPQKDGLIFTDEKGVPKAPQLMLTLGEQSDKPAGFYVRRALTHTEPVSVPIVVQVYAGDGNPQELATLEVHLEENYDAWWRHFRDLLFGPTTPLLALAAALVGFGWQWWQEEQKHRQAQLRQVQLDEIKEVETLVTKVELAEGEQKRVLLTEADQRLGGVTTKYGAEPDLRSALEAARKSVRLAQMHFVREVLALTDRYEAYRQWEDLEKKRGVENWTDPELVASLEQTEAAIKPQSLDWPELWPDKAQRRDSLAITAWREKSSVDLNFNPFGPDRAEEDPLLPQLFVEPPGWELMKTPEPTVVFGANGSGRTASRLLLAHTCTTTSLGPDRTGGQVDTFPVRLALFPEGKLDEGTVTCWRVLTRAVVQDSLEFLAKNPQTFAETPSRQQRALARLFRMHRHYLGDLAEYLGGVGLENRAGASHLADSIQRAARGTRPPARTDEADLLSTLAEARLSHFQQVYVLAEVPDEVSARLSPQEIVPHLKPLLQIVKSLTVRKVYVKLFIPTNVENAIEPLEADVGKVELIWEAPTLGEMLESRVRQAGAASFRALFRHLPEGIDPAALLIQAALESEGPPRRLIQLGQGLLDEHVRRAPVEPKLRWEELKAVLEKSAQGGRP